MNPFLFHFPFERFTTADKVAGGRGFRAVWTEVKLPGMAGFNDCDDSLYFRCANSSFCIAKHLECDGNLNCGLDDDSDEAHCNYRLTWDQLMALFIDCFYLFVDFSS